MPVHLVSNVDVPVPEEVSKLGDLHPPREHRGGESVPQRVRREPVSDPGRLGSVA